MSKGRVRIGKIVGCHGLRGDVKVRPASDDPSWSDHLKQVFLTPAEEEASLQIADIRMQGPMILMRFASKTSRNDVEELVGQTLYADSNALPSPDDGEYWVDDLIGLEVVDKQTQRKKGTVKDLLSSAGQDYLEIQLEHVSETVVIPFINRFFPEVDLEKQVIYVDFLSDFIDDPGHSALRASNTNNEAR